MTEPKPQETGEAADRIINKLGNPVAVVGVVILLGALWVASYFSKSDATSFREPEDY